MRPTVNVEWINYDEPDLGDLLFAVAVGIVIWLAVGYVIGAILGKRVKRRD